MILPAASHLPHPCRMVSTSRIVLWCGMCPLSSPERPPECSVRTVLNPPKKNSRVAVLGCGRPEGGLPLLGIRMAFCRRAASILGLPYKEFPGFAIMSCIMTKLSLHKFFAPPSACSRFQRVCRCQAAYIPGSDVEAVLPLQGLKDKVGRT